MKRVVLALLALTGAARADAITPPTGWTADPERSNTLTTKALTMPRFGGVASLVRVVAFTPPEGQGALWVTRAEAGVAAEQRDAAATTELNELRETARRQAGATIEASAQRADVATKQLEATLTWRDDALVSISRTVIAATTESVVAVTGECLLSGSAPALAQACAAALATLDPEIPAAQRVALAIVEVPPSGDGPEGPEPAVPGPSRPGVQPRLDAGPRGMPPMTISAARPEPDRRPVYLGAGIVVMALAFWWNRRRRERFERDDRDQREPRAVDDDDDGDDLHAAARGEAAPDDRPGAAPKDKA